MFKYSIKDLKVPATDTIVVHTLFLSTVPLPKNKVKQNGLSVLCSFSTVNNNAIFKQSKNTVPYRLLMALSCGYVIRFVRWTFPYFDVVQIKKLTRINSKQGSALIISFFLSIFQTKPTFCPLFCHVPAGIFSATSVSFVRVSV